jgi:hypothetical protein
VRAKIRAKLTEAMIGTSPTLVRQSVQHGPYMSADPSVNLNGTIHA